LVAAGFLSTLAVIAVWFVQSRGYTCYYGDAEAHLNIARHIIDSRTPGVDQIGTVWLPVPHLMMLPFVARDEWWRSGLGGAIPSAICFVIAGLFLWGAARIATGSRAAAFAAAALFALNPNVLYLGSIPMSEMPMLAGFFGLLFSTVWFGRTGSLWAVLAAAFFSNWTSLSRYEGWFLIPFATLYILLAAPRRRWLCAILFGALASLGPLAWLAHNYWYFSNPLEFYNGKGSALAIQGGKHYPGKGDWAKAWLYFRTAARWCSGTPLLWMGVAGIAAAARRRAFWPVALCALLPAFYVVSVHGSGTPIFVPDLWTKSYYNTRYGLAALPLLAFAGGAIAGLGPRRLRAVLACAVVAVAVAPWIANPRPDAWITWKESEVNSVTRRAWTAQAADYLRSQYRPGDGVLTSFGDQTGIYRAAGIPLRDTLHEGNNPEFLAAIDRPDEFVREKWAVTRDADVIDRAMVRSVLRGPRFALVKTIVVKEAPPIQIYERQPEP